MPPWFLQVDMGDHSLTHEALCTTYTRNNRIDMKGQFNVRARISCSRKAPRASAGGQNHQNGVKVPGELALRMTACSDLCHAKPEVQTQ